MGYQEDTWQGGLTGSGGQKYPWAGGFDLRSERRQGVNQLSGCPTGCDLGICAGQYDQNTWRQ